MICVTRFREVDFRAFPDGLHVLGLGCSKLSCFSANAAEASVKSVYPDF